MEWEKNICKHVSDKEVISKIYKELHINQQPEEDQII
jgi:hypothetical protein